MKKVMAMVLSLVMLMTAASFSVVRAEGIGDNKILDLDFANWNPVPGAWGVVENTRGDKTGRMTKFSVADADKDGVPSTTLNTMGSFTAEDGTVVPYVEFDGSDHQHIAFGGSENYEAVCKKDEMTVEFWMKPEFESGKYAKFFQIGAGSNPSKSWWAEMGPDNSGYILVAQGSSVAARTNQMQNKCGDWMHLVLTRNIDRENTKTEFNMYVNGDLIGSGSTDAIVEDDTSVCFGGSFWTTGADTYKGAFGAVRMYDAVMTADDVKNAYEAEAYLYKGISRYTILDVDVDKWDNTVDQFGLNYNSNMDKAGNVVRWNLSTNAPAKSTFTAMDGTEVPYIKFDGVEEQRIAIGGAEGFDKFSNKDETTVEMWAKMQFESGKYPKIFQIAKNPFPDGKSWWVEAGYDNNGFIQVSQLNQGNFRVNNLMHLNGQWAHLALTRKFNDDNTITYKLYIDGVKGGETTIDGNHTTVNDDGSNLCFGGGYWAADTFYTGGFGEIKMYSTVLSDTAIANHYAEKKALFKTPEDDLKLAVNFNNIPTFTDNAGNADSFWTDGIAVEDKDTLGEKTYLKFDGTKKQYVAFGAQQTNGANAVLNNKDITLNFWVYTNDNTKAQSVFSFSEGTKADTSWRLQIENGALRQYGRDTALGKPVDIENGEWANVVVTRSYDENAKTASYQTYVNGQLCDTASQTFDEVLDEKYVFFGDNHWRTESLDGGLAQVKVYGSILPASYIAKTYANEMKTYEDNGVLSVTETEFVDDMDNNPIDQISGNDGIIASFVLSNTSKKAKDYKAYAAIYNADGSLKTVTSKTGSVAAGTNSKLDYFGISAENVPENGSIKVFIWTNDESITPVLTEDFELPYTVVRGNL